MQFKLKVHYLLLVLVFMSFASLANAQYTISSLPSPKSHGQQYYVSNPDKIIDADTEEELNRISANIEEKTKAEYAVVIISDFEGDDIFDFSHRLFEHWGIGKKDLNNGLLLVVAQNRREYYFITGYGMEAIFPDANLKSIGEKYLVPNFKNSNYGAGLLEASEVIQNVLLSPDSKAELQHLAPAKVPFFSFSNDIFINTLLVLAVYIVLYLWMGAAIKSFKGIKVSYFDASSFWGTVFICLLLAFLSIFPLMFIFDHIYFLYNKENMPLLAALFGTMLLLIKYSSDMSRLTQKVKDIETKRNLIHAYWRKTAIPMLASPLVWLLFLFKVNGNKKNRFRFVAPDNQQGWRRLNRDADQKSIAKALTAEEKLVEKIGSAQYDVWINEHNNAVVKKEWEQSRRFAECPKCHVRALKLRETKTIRMPTYASTGEEDVFDLCANCNYRIEHGIRIIPKRVRASSSGSSSSSGGSSSSSSSSSSGSFGGGSSGGGGAGGRW